MINEVESIDRVCAEPTRKERYKRIYDSVFRRTKVAGWDRPPIIVEDNETDEVKEIRRKLIEQQKRD